MRYSSLCDVIERQTDNSLIMALERLHEFSLLDVPQLDGLVCAAGDQVGRVARELAVPHPLQVPLQRLVLRYLEFTVVHVHLEQLDLLVG
jgi:hypothetical protein